MIKNNNDYDIDIVILWVDGSDSEWLKEKNKFSKDRDTSKDVVRYRDWEVLNYWFRAVEKNMPWVRKIHFVTWGHLPSWLNTSHPKLNIVKHSDFIPSEFLPTFNSPVIEMNIHRIPGLAEHFIYFNDDMFVLQPMEKGDFFVNGKPCDVGVMNAITCMPGAENESSIQFNNAGIINKYFNKREVLRRNFFQWFNLKYGKQLVRNFLLYSWPYFTGFYTCHLPTSMKVSSFNEVWEKESIFMNKMCLNKFRSRDMINQWLISAWQMCKGDFYPRSPKIGQAFALSDDVNNNNDIFNVIINKRYKMICINDYIYDDKMFDEIKEALKNSFDHILVEKSEYEK